MGEVSQLRRRYGRARKLRTGKRAAAEVLRAYETSFVMAMLDGRDVESAHLSARENALDALREKIDPEQIRDALPGAPSEALVQKAKDSREAFDLIRPDDGW